MNTFINNEKRIISLINEVIPSGPARLNKSFDAESEILYIDKNLKLLLTMDDFSVEDQLRENDPYLLGWNIAVGGISDILAVGGFPVFYAHAMVIDRKWDDEFIKKFCKGIADVLRLTSTTFAGGDLGKDEVWRYTSTVIGKLHGEPVLRSGAVPGNSIYITGKIGTGNLEAFLRMLASEFSNPVFKNISDRFPIQFNIPFHESELVSKYATTCIDTSDGMFNSLNAVAEVNGTGYEIDSIPYLDEGLEVIEMLKKVSLPLNRILLFLAECGEFELLFTVDKFNEEKMLEEAEKKHYRLYRVGTVTEKKEGSFMIIHDNGKRINLSDMNIRGRDYANPQAYLAALLKWVNENI